MRLRNNYKWVLRIPSAVRKMEIIVKRGGLLPLLTLGLVVSTVVAPAWNANAREGDEPAHLRDAGMPRKRPSSPPHPPRSDHRPPRP